MLGEVQHTVDDVVVIARGRLVHASSLAELASMAGTRTYVETPDPELFAALCAEQGWECAARGAGHEVADVPAATVGAAAYAAGLELHQLATRGADLEDVFLRLTGAVA